MQKLKFLGYGNAFAKMSKNTSAFLILDDKFVLFDCGENIYQTLVEKQPFSGCKKIIILLTHFHSDHTGSVGSFVFSLRNLGYGPQDIFVYNPETENLKNMIDLFDLQEDCKMLTNLTEMFEDKIYTIQQKHYKKFSYGYVVWQKDIKIYYSGDTAEVPKQILDNIEQFDYIYVDTTKSDPYGYHIEFSKLKKIIDASQRHKVVCMHLPDGIDRQKILQAGFCLPEQI